MLTKATITVPVARTIVVATAILMAVARIPMLAVMHRPEVDWDEMTYLNFGRFLAGAGPPLDLRYDPNVEHAGYGAILVPAFVTRPPFEIAYHLTLGINLVLSFALTLLAYRIARRVAGASRSTALLCAIALTAYPDFFVLPLFVFSENLVFPLVLVSVLAFYELLRSARNVWWHAAFAVSIVGMWFAHAPTVVVAAAALAAIIVVAVARRVPWPYAIADVLVIAVGVGIVQAVHRSLWPLSWGNETDTTLGPQILAAVSLRGLADSLREFCYQQAAVVLPSLGAYVLALAMLIRELFVAGRRRLSDRALTCAYVLTAMLGAATSSAFFLITVPGVFAMPDAVFTTRYIDEGAVAALAVGLPLFFSLRDRLRAPVVYAGAAIAFTAAVAYPVYVGSVYAGRGESINEIAWAGFAGLLRGGPMFALAGFALAALVLVVAARRLAPAAGLLVLIAVWLAAGISEVEGQIRPQQVALDELIGADTSKLAPYLRVVPQPVDVAYAASGFNILMHNLLALDVSNHSFTTTAWRAGEAPRQDLAVAPRAVAPVGFTEIVCERVEPAACLYARDRTTASYLLGLERSAAFAPRTTLAPGDSLEIGVAKDASAAWSGVYNVQMTQARTPFRWTNGNARVVLPLTTEPAGHARIVLAAANAGRAIVELQRPGRAPARLLDAPVVKDENSYTIPIGRTPPGTAVSIVTTNVAPGSTAAIPLSVELRSFRLVR